MGQSSYCSMVSADPDIRTMASVSSTTSGLWLGCYDGKASKVRVANTASADKLPDRSAIQSYRILNIKKQIYQIH